MSREGKDRGEGDREEVSGSEGGAFRHWQQKNKLGVRAWPSSEYMRRLHNVHVLDYLSCLCWSDSIRWHKLFLLPVQMLKTSTVQHKLMRCWCYLYFPLNSGFWDRSVQEQNALPVNCLLTFLPFCSITLDQPRQSCDAQKLADGVKMRSV